MEINKDDINGMVNIISIKFSLTSTKNKINIKTFQWSTTAHHNKLSKDSQFMHKNRLYKQDKNIL